LSTANVLDGHGGCCQEKRQLDPPTETSLPHLAD
jgi:hypothetical protein